MQTVRRPPGQFAHRLGRAAGRAACWLQHSEHRAVNWLVARDLSVSVATTLLWVIKLIVLGVLSYVAFWLALLLAFSFVGAWVASQDRSDDEFELQYPTTIEELRNTPGYDPNLHEDTSHEMYRND